MRDEKEGRKKQARSNKQHGKATQHTIIIYCIPRKYNVPLIITSLTSALNSLKFVVVNVLRYAHAHVKHVKNRYHKGTLKWQD